MTCVWSSHVQCTFSQLKAIKESTRAIKISMCVTTAWAPWLTWEAEGRVKARQNPLRARRSRPPLNEPQFHLVKGCLWKRQAIIPISREGGTASRGPRPISCHQVRSGGTSYEVSQPWWDPERARGHAQFHTAEQLRTWQGRPFQGMKCATATFVSRAHKTQPHMHGPWGCSWKLDLRGGSCQWKQWLTEKQKWAWRTFFSLWQIHHF